MASRCNGGCGRFVKAHERFCPDCFTAEEAELDRIASRLLGSATIPDSDFEKQLAKLTQQATLPPEDVEQLAQNVRDLSPVRRRWPWRKRR